MLCSVRRLYASMIISNFERPKLLTWLLSQDLYWDSNKIDQQKRSIIIIHEAKGVSDFHFFFHEITKYKLQFAKFKYQNYNIPNYNFLPFSFFSLFSAFFLLFPSFSSLPSLPFPSLSPLFLFPFSDFLAFFRWRV